jgi:hypothetical protein
MSRISLGLALALLLLFSLLATAPARLLASLLPAGQVHMEGFTGTLWRGAASRCLVRVGPGYLHLGSVRWELAPLSLLTLAPRLALESQWGQQRFAGDVVLRGEQDFDFHNFDVTVAADLLRRFAPITLGGHLNASFDELVLRDRFPVSAEGRLVWQNAAWESPQGLMPLGTYAIDIVPEGEAGLRGEVLTLSGQVNASGSVALTGRRYTVDVLMGSADGLDEQVQRALSLIATPEGDSYRASLEGEFEG